MGPTLSIVIPARNDAEALARTLQALAGVDGIERAEVIVAASGDPDGTRRAVGERGRLVWPAGSTRAELMNAGAAAAHGPILLFLHADTTLPRGALTMIAGALADRADRRRGLRPPVHRAAREPRRHQLHQSDAVPADGELLRRPGPVRAGKRVPWRSTATPACP